ncbi:putative membrane protein [Bradyrhizobium japonicum]
MFDGPFDVFALIIAIISVLIAIKASSQAAELRRRLASLEEMFYAQRQVQPPPLMPAQAQAEAPATTAAEPPPLAPEAEAAPPPLVTEEVSPPPLAASTEADAPPPLPAPAPGFEERLGTRWVVWIGGLALALGGFFMVRYSIEAGLVGPGARVFLGGLFAAALLGAGEWSRRKESISNIAALPIANIPAILTAAGTAVAFATIYAAYALYGFLVPATAFVLLGIVAMGTLAAALLHGPALAGLGVVGAFVTPILVSSGKPDYWALYIYLAIVTAASFGLARIRLWRWLAVTTIAFAVLWIFPGLDTSELQVAPHAFHAIAGFVLAALLVVCGFMFGPTIEGGEIEPVSSSSLGAYLFGAMLIVLSSAHADLALIAFTLLVGATLFVAWRAPAATGALGAAAATVFIVFAEWAVRANPDMLVLPGGPMPGVGPVATDSSVTLHLVMAAIFAAGFGIAGFFAQGRSSSAIIPVVWSAAAVATPIAILVALYARIAHLDRSIPFAILAVLLAAAFGAATEALARREDRPGAATSVALFATGTLGALALALTFALEKGWLTIALALMSLGTAYLAAAADPGPAPARRHLRRDRDRAHRLRSTHRRRCRRHHADLQLAAVGLRPAGGLVLGREHLPAPPR